MAAHTHVVCLLCVTNADLSGAQRTRSWLEWTTSQRLTSPSHVVLWIAFGQTKENWRHVQADFLNPP
ncbi:hypothetical protein RRG08_042389 [Elysia crispata]|nr:hypothetical protein RRG08_042389 [Elysia crispata]